MSAQDGDRAVARLMQYASPVRLGPAVAGCLVNVSFLLTADRQYGLSEADLNLDLGPLGTLL